MSRVFGALFVLIAVPFLTASASATTTNVSARLSDNGHYLADFSVNGAPSQTFIIDTAAQSTIVFESFADSANLEAVNDGNRIMVQGASGLVEARRVTLGTLTSGDWVFDAGDAIVIPDVPHLNVAVGILGAGTLFQQPVGFNAADGLIDIFSTDPSFDPASVLGGDWISVPARSRDSTSFLWATVEINGVSFDALIDTGARRSAVNLSGASALGIADPAAAGFEEGEPIRGASHHSQAAWRLPVETISLGAKAWEDAQIYVSDLAVFQMLGSGDQPTIVLGADLLAEGYFIVDAPGKRLWFPVGS